MNYNYDLTNTEREIAKLVSRGFPNKENTVHTQLMTIYQKINIADSNKGNDGTKRVRLVLWYLEQVK